VAIFCSLLYFYITAEQQIFESEFAILERKQQQQQTLVNELKNDVENIKVDPSLLKEMEEKQQIIRLKKLVLDELAGQEDLKSIGFSKLMLELASNKQNGLWLTHINLNGMDVMIKGAALDSAFVPRWVRSLGKTDYFRGQKFSDTRLYRDYEDQLNFVIQTSKELTKERSSSNE
jgi:Tfp pilus assembly protein PilN